MDSTPSPHRDEPDHSQDPRTQQTGDAGYPETQPEGASPTEGTRDQGPEAGSGGPEAETSDTDAPSTSNQDEADRGASTGNPDNAG